jgi:hypothetical protein
MTDRMTATVTLLNADTERTVVCDTCCMPVAEYSGRFLSAAGVDMAITRHLDHPRSELTLGIEHELETYNHKTNRMTWGIVLKGDQIL